MLFRLLLALAAYVAILAHYPRPRAVVVSVRSLPPLPPARPALPWFLDPDYQLAEVSKPHVH